MNMLFLKFPLYIFMAYFLASQSFLLCHDFLFCIFLTNQSSSFCTSPYFDNRQFLGFLSRDIFPLFYILRFLYFLTRFPLGNIVTILSTLYKL